MLAQHVLLTLDVALLRTSARRLGRDRARLAAVAVATWATIAVGAGGVTLAMCLRLGLAAGMPLPVARAIVTAAIVSTMAASLVRLACASGLAARLAGPDALRTALDVRSQAGVALGAVVHVWMLGVATLPLAVTWSTWDASSEVVVAAAGTGLVALAGCLVLARSSSDRRPRAPRARAVLGTMQRAEVAAIAGATMLAVASLLPIATATRAALASASTPLAGFDVATSAVVAGAATLVASDRLLDPDARSRLRRAIALVDVGASRASVVARSLRPSLVAWGALAALGSVSAVAWGASVVHVVGVGGAILAVGVAAEALAMGVDALATRVVAAALVVAVVAIAPTCSTLVLAALAIAAAAATTTRRLRCPPS